jgi:hypothetical protein
MLMTKAMDNVAVFDEVLADLDPGLELLEAELIGIEVEMGITGSCVCTLWCGNKLLDAATS